MFSNAHKFFIYVEILVPSLELHGKEDLINHVLTIQWMLEGNEEIPS